MDNKSNTLKDWLKNSIPLVLSRSIAKALLKLKEKRNIKEKNIFLNIK